MSSPFAELAMYAGYHPTDSGLGIATVIFVILHAIYRSGKDD